jgi:hypothetical protein
MSHAEARASSEANALILFITHFFLLRLPRRHAEMRIER